MTFDVSTLRVATIRHDDDYGGWRVVLVAQLGPRLRVQVDIGIGDMLSGAISSTFGRRGTALGPELPVALTPAFASVPGQREQWAGFLRKNRLPFDAGFDLVVADVAKFLQPVAAAPSGGDAVAGRRPPGGPWE
jgi:hypothetical protein